MTLVIDVQAYLKKNVVGKNGEWQLSNGDCTTEGTVVSIFGMQKQ